MSIGPDPIAGRPVVEQVATHVDDRFTATKNACRTTVTGTPELDYLAHYQDCAFNFAISAAQHRTDSPDWTDYERIGTQVSNTYLDLNRSLRDLRTGALIRMVVHGEDGMLVCDSGRRREHVIGISRDRTSKPAHGSALSKRPGARNTDKAVGDLATRLRQQVSLSSLNPGGWQTEQPHGDVRPSVAVQRVGTPTHQPFTEGNVHMPLSRLVDEALDPKALQFVAYCRSGELRRSADYLGDPTLGPYFQEISVAERRLGYHNLCRRLPMIVRGLGRITASIVGRKVYRVVLDVEEGAIYYYRVLPGEYLVGVTIIQDRVAVAEDRIAELTLQWRQQSTGPFRAVPGSSEPR